MYDTFQNLGKKNKKRRPKQNFQKEMRAISEVNIHVFDKATHKNIIQHGVWVTHGTFREAK